MTPKQKEALDFIRSYICENNGVSPSYQEITDALGIKSKSGASRVIASLVEIGVICKDPYRARRITIPGGPETEAVRANALREVRRVATGMLQGRINKKDAAQKLLVLSGAGS